MKRQTKVSATIIILGIGLVSPAAITNREGLHDIYQQIKDGNQTHQRSMQLMRYKTNLDAVLKINDSLATDPLKNSANQPSVLLDLPTVNKLKTTSEEAGAQAAIEQSTLAGRKKTDWTILLALGGILITVFYSAKFLIDLVFDWKQSRHKSMPSNVFNEVSL